MAGRDAGAQAACVHDGVQSHLTNVVVECLQALQYLLIDRHDPVATEPAIAAVTLNMLKYASSACLFLGLSDQVLVSSIIAIVIACP